MYVVPPKAVDRAKAAIPAMFSSVHALLEGSGGLKIGFGDTLKGTHRI